MRTIKFRAWETQYKLMSPVTHVDFVTNEIDCEHNSGEPKRIEHFEIMQFTGLLDKNGKEIYEGDILTFLDAETISTENGMDFNESMGRGVVEWCGYEGRWGVTNRDSVDLEDIFGEPDTEIIGNIHENPELLP
jgi:uncharacterized phage protein (TIGR01671 family)